MQSVNHQVLIACIGKFEYMFDLILLPDCSEIEVELFKTYRGLGTGKRRKKEQKKKRQNNCFHLIILPQLHKK